MLKVVNDQIVDLEDAFNFVLEIAQSAINQVKVYTGEARLAQEQAMIDAVRKFIENKQNLYRGL